MDMFRRLRSSDSSSLSAAVEQSKKEDVAEQWPKSSDREGDEQGDEEVNDILLHDDEQEQEDGDVFEDAAAALQQQRQHEDEQQEQQRASSNGNDEQEAPTGVSPIRVRAPVSDEEEELDDDGGARGEEEEEEDGRGSYGSGESFDSALERMAASSEVNDSSPVGSLQVPAFGIGSAPPGLSPSQQGALLRLNEMISGDSSLDTSVIDNSTGEEFKSRVSELAENRGSSLDDFSFASIVDALLPLVEGKSPEQKTATLAEEEDDDETPAPDYQEAKEEVYGNGALENGGDYSDYTDAGEKVGKGEEDSEVQEQPQITEQGPDAEKVVEGTGNSVPDSNGGHACEGESSGDDQPEQHVPEQHVEEPLVEATGEADTQEKELPSETAAVPETNRNNDEDSSAKEVSGEAAIREDSAESEEEIQPREAPPAVSEEVPAGESVEIGSGEAEGEAEGEADGEDMGKGPTVNVDYAVGEDEDDEGDEDDDDENDGDEDVGRRAAVDALVWSAAAGSVGSSQPETTPSLGSAGPSLPARPQRLVKSTVPSLEPAPRVTQQPRSTEATSERVSSSAENTETNGEPDGNEDIRQKLQLTRVKFLRLALRLGQSVHNVVVAQVLYRLGLAEQLKGGRTTNRSTAFSFDRASSIAEEQEKAGREELDFACTIMLLGKTGVGKSATINSIFGEAKTATSAFGPATRRVQVIEGLVHGIKLRVIDTPGLLPSIADQRHNEKVMGSVKSFIKKESPDIVLYFDRLDMQSRDYGDLPLLRTITDTFGAAVWFNAIVVLTHASSAPPDGPNGLALSYEMFVAQRSHVVQQTIRTAAGDMRLMNPVSLVENHTLCRKNRDGERVLPNGQVWKPQLLLLCFSSKILAEANSLLKLQDNTPGKPFGQRSRVPPLPFLLSSLLQSRAPLKMPDDQQGDDDESDEELEEDESDDEEDYDQLPPFRRLAKEEVDELDEGNRGKYFEELAERERLFQKKQYKEEMNRRRELKRRMAEEPLGQAQLEEEVDEEPRSAAVPVPMPDMVLPPSFDSDNPSHRYRYLETANQWLVRPVLDTHGWDHDSGYDGMSVEKLFVVRDKIPVAVSGQVTKDKKEANLNMECAGSLKHGEGKVTLAGLDLQTVGKDLAYTLRSETRFNNFKGNKTTGGLALTLLGDTVSAGMKIEDRLVVGKRVKLVVNGGAITGAGDVAYGGSLEATLRDKEYPLSRTLSTLGVSVMDWHGDLAVGGNFQSQFVLGKTMMVGRANLNNRGAGQISIRASSSEQLQMTLIGLIPIVRALVNRLLGQNQQ